MSANLSASGRVDDVIAPVRYVGPSEFRGWAIAAYVPLKTTVEWLVALLLLTMLLPLIGALLGHSSPATTARYAHMFRSPMMEATERVGAVIEAAMTGKQSPELLQFPGKGKIA